LFVLSDWCGRKNRLPKAASIHQEPSHLYVGYVYTHEHDFVLTNKRGEKNRLVLGCQMCNILQCERCGKEVSLCTISIEAKGEEFKRL
jgi:hypothetical protein